MGNGRWAIPLWCRNFPSGRTGTFWCRRDVSDSSALCLSTRPKKRKQKTYTVVP